MSLPSGYTRLEYIESTGTQYIDTGYHLNSNNEKIEMKFRYTESFSGKTLIGTQDSAYSTATRYSINIYQNTLYVGASHNVANLGITVGTDYECTIIANGSNGSIVENRGAATSFAIRGDLDHADNILIFCGDIAGTPNLNQAAAARLYYCKIYDNGMLVRDFIPCKNASGVAGLWDDVNSQFYQNAGTGSFIAGEMPKGTHKTLVNGAAYTVKGGKCLVNGTVYSIKKGRTLIGGTGYDITLPGIGIRVSTLSVGQSVYAKVNGTAKEFIVVHQGKPSSIYDESCNGTWLLMKDIYESRVWNASGGSDYENSDINKYLNGTFLNLFESNIIGAIKQVKIPYRKGGGSTDSTITSGANGLSTKIFLLSAIEVQFDIASIGAANMGSVLSYFQDCIGAESSREPKRIAYLNGTATEWYLRTPSISPNSYGGLVFQIDSRGGWSGTPNTTKSHGIRPALILRSDALVDNEFNIIS